MKFTVIFCLFLGFWNSWYTIYCVLQKRRKFNSSVVEIINVTITSLDECDRLDFNYSLLKFKKIQINADLEIKRRKESIEIKLKQIEKDFESYQMIVTSFSWLAVVMISLVFIMVSFNFLKFFLFSLK